MFRQANPRLVRAHFPDFRGNVYLHELQVHIVEGVTEPILDRYVHGGNITVDLGCGSGTTVKRLAQRGAIAIGVDVDTSAFDKHPELSVIEGALKEMPSQPGAYLLAGDISQLPLPEDSVDLVTSRWVFEHLADPATVIAQIRRVLKPGGLALIIVPNVRHPGILVSSLMPLRLKRALLRSSSGIEDDLVMETYYRANTDRALDRLFAVAGFEKLGLAYVQDPSYWLFSSTLFRTAVGIGRITRKLPLQRFRMHMVGLYRYNGDDGIDRGG